MYDGQHLLLTDAHGKQLGAWLESGAPAALTGKAKYEADIRAAASDDALRAIFADAREFCRLNNDLDAWLDIKAAIDAQRAIAGTEAADAEDAAITEDQALHLDGLIDDVGADRDKFLAHYNLTHIGALPAEDYDDIVALLGRKRKAKGKGKQPAKDKEARV